MAGSVGSAKDAAKLEDKAADAAKSSPADLLKKAVAGRAETKAESAAPAAANPLSRLPLRIDARLTAAVAIALVVGTSFGLVAAPRERSGEALARIEAGLEAGRSEAGRLNSEIERLTKSVASLRDSTDVARSDVRALASALTDRVMRLDQGLDKKFAALTEKVAHPEREQSAPSVGPAAAEKRAAAPAATGTTIATSTPKGEPTQTGSITETKADAKPKPETVEAWALRDVYDGIAMLEDRKRRLLEVAPGDSVPGIGRVESIERRGRIWVVVTKQGVITPQTW